MTSKRGATIRRRTQGVSFLVVLFLLLWLTVLEYQHAFQSVAHVTLHTDSIGNQLEQASDVKVHGVIVGEVRDVKAGIKGATIDLAIYPQYLKRLPANVTAQLLPKTLFGERFVSLVSPSHPESQRLTDGSVISQDRTKNAIELEKVIDDLYPLLKAVPPQDISYTLGAVANALRGRGNALGQNLASTGSYVGQVNTVLPQLEADISKLADFSDTYESASQDLLAVLDNLSVTSQTVVDQQQQLKRTFTTVSSSSNTVAQFLETNEANLIQLASTSVPVLGTFARFSPEYPCLLTGLAKFDPLESAAWTNNGHPGLQLNITVTFPPRNPYIPGDQPQYASTNGPDCKGLNNLDAIMNAAQHGEYYCPTPPADGVHSADNPVSGNPDCLGGTGPNDVPAGAGNPDPGQSLTSPVGSSAELDFVKSILGFQTGADPGDVPDLAAATMAPLLRGTQVVLP